VIRVFQIVGACIVIIYCLVELGQNAQLPQTEVLFRGVGRMGYIARWQAEIVYTIFIITCSSLVIHTPRANRSGAGNPEDEHDNI
jgi:hypothetical protein